MCEKQSGWASNGGLQERDTSSEFLHASADVIGQPCAVPARAQEVHILLMPR